MTLRIAYLGPQGTFSEEAASCFQKVFTADSEITHFPTIEDCAEAVEDGAAEYAVVPMENSLEGSVHVTLDILTTSAELHICGELALDIVHNLLAVDGTPDDVRQVFSHPQAIAQCRNFLRRHLAGAETIPVFSTAEAAAMVSRSGQGTAAIGSIRAAERYQLKVLCASIQDNGNRTRFIVLTKNGSLPGTPGKTSLLFAVKDGPGSLFRVLQSFASHGVNLTRIESRTSKRQLGDYLFFVDLAGTPEDPAVKASLREAAREAVMLKLLGTYPVLGLVSQ